MGHPIGANHVIVELRVLKNDAHAATIFSLSNSRFPFQPTSGSSFADQSARFVQS